MELFHCMYTKASVPGFDSMRLKQGSAQHTCSTKIQIVVVTESIWPGNPNTITIWIFVEQVCCADPCFNLMESKLWHRKKIIT